VSGWRTRRAPALLLLAALCCATPPVEPQGPAPAEAATGRPLLQLGPPPGAIETRRELERILAIQAAATPERKARARADVELSLFQLLPGEDEEELRPWRPPSLAALSDRVVERVLKDLEPLKRHWARPRPYTLEPAIRSCIPPLESFSYPSGHAAFAFAGARILAELAPERADAIWARAREFAWSRVVCGVHFPSDVAAGETLGREIGAELLASPALAHDLVAARRDLRAALGLPPDRAPLDRSRGPASPSRTVAERAGGAGQRAASARIRAAMAS